VLLLIGFVALAERFGLQTILGAFLAGVILRIVDPEVTATHPHFWLKLEGIGYGFLIPVFFVSSGVEFNLSALLSSASTMVRVVLATWNIHATKYALMISSISVFTSLST
jgi:Kef-type K+ transport system membrane component KefB